MHDTFKVVEESVFSVLAGPLVLVGERWFPSLFWSRVSALDRV